MPQTLFSSITLAGMPLSNRIAMAPMTRNRAPHGLATPLMAEYYRQRASAGLIISEGAQISPLAVGYPATPGIHHPDHVTAWRIVTDAVHAEGGHIFCQLWHCGRVSHPDFHDGALPVAPSAIAPATGQAFTYEGLKDFVVPRALTVAEIQTIVSDYAAAASYAVEAGFDGVEIHAANGYLLDQFLRDGSNQRDDAYGGSLENRTRFLLEVCTAVSEAIGSNKVGVRLSPVNAFNDMHDSAPQALFNHVCSALAPLSLAYLHVVEVSMTGAPDHTVDMQQLRKNFGGCYIANGAYDADRARAAIANGSADMVSFGIPFLANPDLPARLERGAALNEADQTTFYGGDEHGYTDYPALP